MRRATYFMQPQSGVVLITREHHTEAEWDQIKTSGFDRITREQLRRLFGPISFTSFRYTRFGYFAFGDGDGYVQSYPMEWDAERNDWRHKQRKAAA